MTNQQTAVDVNVLIKLYNQKMATLANQNVLLEAKLHTITQDFLDEKKELLANQAELQEKYENLLADIEEDGETRD